MCVLLLWLLSLLLLLLYAHYTVYMVDLSKTREANIVICSHLKTPKTPNYSAFLSIAEIFRCHLLMLLCVASFLCSSWICFMHDQRRMNNCAIIFKGDEDCRQRKLFATKTTVKAKAITITTATTTTIAAKYKYAESEYVIK